MTTISKIQLFFIFLFISVTANASNYYWVGGTGNWSDFDNHWATSSGGSNFHAQIPTTADHVFFDNNSLTKSSKVTFDQTSITCANFTVALTGNDSIIFYGNNAASTVNVYGSVLFCKKASFDFTGTVALKGSATNRTITQAGALLNISTFTFDGVNGNWTIVDSLHTLGVNFLSGTLNATNKIINCYSFTSSSSNPRNLQFTRTKLKVASIWTIETTNLTYDFSNSKFKLETFSVRPGKLNYDTIVSNFAIVTSACNIKILISNSPNANVRLWPGVVIDNLITNSNLLLEIDNATIKNLNLIPPFRIEIEGTFTTENLKMASGDCKKMSSIKTSEGVPCYLSQNSGQVNLDYVYIDNTIATGGASFIANHSIGLGENTGFQFTNTISNNLYWIGGTGSWNDPNHWSLTSGGTPYNCIPTSLNNVFFDKNSLSQNGQKITIPQDAKCKSFDFSQAAYTAIVDGSPKVFGSFILRKGLTFTASNALYLTTNEQSIINFAGNILNDIIIEAGKGSYTLKDSVNCNSLWMYGTEFYSANYKINCGKFSLSSNPNKIDLGSSHFVIRNGGFSIGNSPLLNAKQAVIYIYKIHLYDGISLGTNVQYNNVNLYSTVGGDISFVNAEFNNLYTNHQFNFGGDFICDSLFLAQGEGINFKGQNYAINQIIIPNDKCVTTLISSFFPAALTKSTGEILLNNISLYNIQASGGAKFTAKNTIDLGGNSGWNITAPPVVTYYWIGGTGNWSDISHWSQTSGGTPAGCIPSSISNVTFDAHSFTSDDQIVNIDQPSTSCRDMVWKDIAYKVALNQQELTVRGSISLSNKLSANNTLHLSAKDSASYKISGAYLSAVNFSGRSRLLDSITNANNVSISNGKFDFSNCYIKSQYMALGSDRQTIINFDGAVCDITEQFDAGTDSLVITKTGKTLTVGSRISVSNLSGLGQGASLIQFPFESVKLTNDDCGIIPCYSYILAYECAFNKLEIERKVKSIYVSIKSAKEFISVANQTIFNAESHIKMADLQSTETQLQNNMSFDNLKLYPGTTLKITQGKVVTINNKLDAKGQAAYPISILSDNQGTQAILNKTTGTVCADYLYLNDIKATGGAQFIAGKNSSNIGNNTGWDFTSTCTLFTASYTQPACDGNDIQLSVTDLGSDNYRWTGPNGFASTKTTPIIPKADFTSNGLYYVTANKDTSYIYVNVTPAPDTSLTFNSYEIISNDQNKEQNTYTWYINGIIYKETANGLDGNSVQVATDGTYYAEITNTGRCSKTSQKVIVQNGSYISLFTQAVSSSEVAVNWSSITNGSSPNRQYLLERSVDEINFTEIAKLGSTITTYTDRNLTANTQYSYRIRIYDYNQYNDYSNVSSALTDIETAVADQTLENKITIYPNPSKGSISVDTKGTSIEKITVYNLLGTSVFDKTYHTNHDLTIHLQLEDVDKGVYFLEITEKQTHNKLIKRIIIQ